MIIKRILLSALCIGLIGIGEVAFAKTYATVNGKAITEKDFEALKQMDPNFDFDKLPLEAKRQIINQVALDYLMQEAIKADKIESSKEYIQALNGIKARLAQDLWLEKKSKSFKAPAPNDAELKKFYEQNEGLFIDQTGSAKHILVASEAEAKDIIAQLDKASNKEAKFSELARAKSLDKASAAQGGDLAQFHRTQMVPEFSKAAFDLKPKTYTKTPVQTQFGYHIIYLQSKSEAKKIPFSQAKQIMIQQNQQASFLQSIQQELLSKAKITINN